MDLRPGLLSTSHYVTYVMQGCVGLLDWIMCGIFLYFTGSFAAAKTNSENRIKNEEWPLRVERRLNSRTLTYKWRSLSSLWIVKWRSRQTLYHPPEKWGVQRMLLVFILHCLICNLKTAPVLVLKMLQLSQNWTVRSDWSCILITSARPSLTFLEDLAW